MPAPKRTFQRRLALIAILLAVAPVIAIGLVLVDVNRDAIRERSEELLFAVTDDVAHVTATSLDEARTELSAVAIALGDSTQAISQRLATARVLVTASGRGVSIYDETGRRVDAILVADSTWHGGPMLAPELRQTAETEGFAVGEVVVDDQAVRVVIVAPIRGEATRWFVATAVSLGPLAERLYAIVRDRFGGRLDAVTVIDSNRRFIVHVDPEQRLAAAHLDVLDGITGAAILTGVFVYRDLEDRGTVGVVRSLPGLPWAVVAQMPRQEVYAPVDRARHLVFVAVAIAAALAILAALLWSRRTARPILDLVQLAQDLGRRNFHKRVELKTGDELETLGRAMTTAATELDASERRLQAESAIRVQLGRYLPGQLVQQIVDNKHPLALEGRRRSITVVFADIAAFTALAEREPPDRVVALLNQLFTVLTEIVFRHGGTVDKLIGDCLMAFWGAPDEQPDHARRGVAAAIDMQRWLDVANDCWETSLGLTIHMAIGVHSGEAIVGNLGSEARMEYTCVGDTVNVAARLESLARPQQILISEATRAELDPSVRCARIGKQQLPGRMAPVELHEVIL